MSHDDHDLGFCHDFPKMLGRRRFLALGAGLAGATIATPSLAAVCTALPWETAGPYPADGSNAKSGQIVNVLTQEGVIRDDLRTSFAGMTPVAEGLELTVEIKLVDAMSCLPLIGHALYLWHCDTTGLYSLYDTTDRNYLRGVGVSDDAGIVRFTTIFPGCYDGRWPHFHFEVFETVDAAVNGSASLLTAQIALPEADCAAVYAADARYSNGTRNLGRITLESDNVFSDNGAEALAQQTMALTGAPESGYAGTVTVPIDLTADGSGVSAAPPMPGENGPVGAPPPMPGETDS